jgi:hypothetical protein
MTKTQFPDIRVLIAGILVFVTAFLVVGSLNRPAHDDLDFIYQASDKGIAGSVVHYYQTWNTRWASIFVSSLYYSSYIKIQSLLPFHFVTLLLLSGICYLLCKNIFGKLNIHSTRTETGVLAMLLVAGTFFSSFSIADAFYWVNTSSMYLWNLMAFMFLISIILSDQSNFIKLITAILMGVYIGGSSEPFVFLILITALPLMYYLIIRNVNKRTVTHLIVFTLMVILAFSISYLGEGHSNRSGFLPQTTIIQKSWILTKSAIKLFIIYLPKKVLITSLFAFSFYFVGQRSSNLFNKYFVGKTTLNLSLFLWVGFIILSILSITPVVLIMSEMGPERSWTQISWMLMICMSAQFYLLGARSSIHQDTVARLNKSVPWILLVFIVVTSSSETMRSVRYADKWDERMEMLYEYKNEGRTELLQIEQKLPETGWLHNAEITSNPDHFTNQHLKSYIKADFNIVLQQEEK